MGITGVGNDLAYQNNVYHNSANASIDDSNTDLNSFQKMLQQADEDEEVNTTKDLMQALRDKMSEMEEKIKNGDTEPTFPIGGQTFTAKQWDKLIEKIDHSIEDIKKEQEERIEKQKEKIELTEQQVKELMEDNTEEMDREEIPIL